MTTDSLTSHWQIPTHIQPIYRAEDGVWHITGYSEAKAVLLADVLQAGFNAEVMEKIPMQVARPVLYQDGVPHREQRSQTQKFFTPSAVQQRHLPLMEQYANEIIADFKLTHQGDLNKMAARIATNVVADVVGLNNSPREGMARRLDTILHSDLDISITPAKIIPYLKLQAMVFQFIVRDVRPAVRARRAAPQEDLISHLLSKGYSEASIATECITYGAAGMVTTQEFICVVFWQMQRHPELRERFIQGDQPARFQVLHELLRLDPVVGHIFRRAASELQIPSDGQMVTIPAGAKIDLHLYEINADPRVVSGNPLEIDSQRSYDRGIPDSILGFGGGPHRCAGEHLAIAETDIFLRKLLAVPGLRIVKEPRMGRNETIQGYELREFLVAAD